jgi:hypothetical protein
VLHQPKYFGINDLSFLSNLKNYIAYLHLMLSFFPISLGLLGLSGNGRGETVNKGCWAGFAPFGYASRPVQLPQLFPRITVIPNDPLLLQGGALEIWYNQVSGY